MTYAPYSYKKNQELQTCHFTESSPHNLSQYSDKPMQLIGKLSSSDKELLVKILNENSSHFYSKFYQVEVEKATKQLIHCIHFSNELFKVLNENINQKKDTFIFQANLEEEKTKIPTVFFQFLKEKYGITCNKNFVKSNTYKVHCDYYNRLPEKISSFALCKKHYRKRIKKCRKLASKPENSNSWEKIILEELLKTKNTFNKSQKILMNTKNSQDTCDLTFTLSNRRFYLPQRLILATSSKLASLLDKKLIKNEGKEIDLSTLTNIPPDLFTIYIDYLYGKKKSDYNYDATEELIVFSNAIEDEEFKEWVEAKAIEAIEPLAGNLRINELQAILKDAEEWQCYQLENYLFHILYSKTNHQNKDKIATIAKEHELNTLASQCDQVKASIEETFNKRLKKAKKGKVEKMFEVALMLKSGLGVPQDLTESYQWFQKAANKEHTLSQVHLAHFHRKGEVVDKNSSYAEGIYEGFTNIKCKYTKAEARYGKGMLLLEEGRKEEALEQFSKAKKQYHFEAAYQYLKLKMEDPLEKKEILKCAFRELWIIELYKTSILNKMEPSKTIPFLPEKDFQERMDALFSEIQQLFSEEEGNTSFFNQIFSQLGSMIHLVMFSQVSEKDLQEDLQVTKEIALMESPKQKIPLLSKLVRMGQLQELKELLIHLQTQEMYVSELIRFAYLGALQNDPVAISLLGSLFHYHFDNIETYFPKEHQQLGLYYASELWKELLQNEEKIDQEIAENLCDAVWAYKDGKVDELFEKNPNSLMAIKIKRNLEKVAELYGFDNNNNS